MSQDKEKSLALARGRQRRYREKNYEAVTARRRAEYHADAIGKRQKNRAYVLWVCYRLTISEYEQILAFQGGVCAGCGEPPSGKRLAVDHEHKTGRIRGLLCWLCNKSVGLLRDSADTATALGAYLRTPTAPAALGKETYGLIGRAKASKKVKIYGPVVAFIKAVE